MTSIRTAAALTALAISTTAGAQAQTFTDKTGMLRFLGCYSQDDGLYCDTTYTLTKGDSMEISANRNELIYYTGDGSTGSAELVSLAGSSYNYSGSTTVVNGVPVKAIYYIKLPSGTKSLPAIVFDGHRINNVVISKTGAPDMTVATPAPAPRPVIPAPTPNAGVTGFNVQLSNCKVSANIYTCTATLTPR